jgi:UDP-N-acetylmuramate dehydrogenase
MVLVVRERVALSGYTTLQLGGPVARFVDADTPDEIVAAVRGADLASEPVLVLGGGSNLVVADTGFAGTVIRVASSGVTVVDGDDGVRVTVAAGENWGQLVDWAVAEKLSGLECLAGIPGLAGATPIQNVGAYGQEVATVIEAVRVYDRASASISTLTGAECGFGYRTSLFKISPMSARQATEPTGRYVVLGVTFRLRRDPMSAPLRYPELAVRLGVASDESAPLADVRAAVLELRRTKGMVLDPADPDTASAGSFFTNPVLDHGQFARLERSVVRRRGSGSSVPHFPADHGRIKVPAGWLIEQAGFTKGYPGHGAARISSKHTLALTNRGGASTADLIDLAREIVSGVRSAFGLELMNEPVLVGVTLESR